MQTNTGELIAIVESTGENIGTAVAAKKAADYAEQIIKNAAKTKELTKKINELTKPDSKKVDAFQKSVEPYLNSEKIINVERLKAIQGIDQIEEFRKYTNNFTNLEKLKPEEILYLNLCDWLEPQAARINAQLHARGGIKVIDPLTKTETIIEKYDLVHSLLGEMKPEALANRTSGGHLMIIELRTATLDFKNIELFNNNFFDIGIKYAGKASEKYKPNSYFPTGTTIEQAVEMIEDAILNSKNIIISDTTTSGKISCDIINKSDQIFALYIENKIATFHPVNPAARYK